MGRKIKNRSNPKLAHSHPEGSAIMPLQSCLHNAGQIGIPKFDIWKIHYNKAKYVLSKLKLLQSDVLLIDPGKSNIRLLWDKKLLFGIYDLGFQMVMNTFLAFEYLITDALIRLSKIKNVEIKSDVYKGDLKQKMEAVAKKTNLSFIKKDIGYSILFSEIERVRNNFNHPKPKTMFNCDPLEWDSVPIAWLVAEKYKDVDKVFSFLEKLHQELEGYFEKYYSSLEGNTTINVERGIESINHTERRKRK